MGPSNRPIYVFDHVRSNSQLFNKIFAAHPQLEQVFMPLIGASLYGPEAVYHGRKHSALTDETFTTLANSSDAVVAAEETFEVAVERLEGAVNQILEKGKIPWLKDHTFCVVPRDVQDVWLAGKTLPDAMQRNPTVLRTEFLEGLTPVFLVRHPALSIPSFFRKDIGVCKNEAGDEDFAVYSALAWSRMIFDSYVVRAGGSLPAKGDKVPIVVDAADVIYNSETILGTLCQKLGIDVAGVQLSWEPLPKEHWPADPIPGHFFDDLFKSSGLERRADNPTEASIDIDAMQRNWSKEFGPGSAETLRKLVDAEVKHYEYLLAFKLRPS